MSIWGKIYKACADLGIKLRSYHSIKSVTDREYRNDVRGIMEERPVHARYGKLIKATCDKFMSDQIMTADEVEHKLTMHMIRLSKSYGCTWMDPITCFSGGNLLDIINHQIDDNLNKVCGTKDKIAFGVLLDLLSYLVLYQTIIEVKEEQKIKNTLKASVMHYVYLTCSSILLAMVFWLFIVTAFIRNDNKVIIVIMSVICLILSVRYLIMRKKPETYSKYTGMNI